jgi:type IV secretory pathway VirB9-like protein
MMKKFILVLMALVAICPVAKAEDVGGCKTIQYKQGRVYLIQSALYKGTHITLPERLMLDPIPGNNALWNVEGNGYHVMVQPNSEERQGYETTLTLITESNRSYNLILRRVTKNHDTCVIIEDEGGFFQGAKKSEYKTLPERENIFLQKQIANLQASLEEEKTRTNRTLDDVLKKYRSFIYTRYTWSKGSGFKGENLVSDVYDDGRFTFIRVVSDQRGVLALSAEIDEKEEMIEYELDSDHIYKISGIYPKFKLQYGASEVTVNRKDNKSNGAY